MPQPLIVANWKLYPTLSDSLVLAASLKSELEKLRGVHVVLAPPLPWLVSVIEHWQHRTGNVDFAAQNLWPDDQGAYTGEVSAYMVKDLVRFALVGHSERRLHAREDDDLIREKVQACLRWQIRPIVCIGEQKPVIDEAGKTDSYQWQRLERQLMEALHGVKEEQVRKIVVAYEPIWAISKSGVNNPAKPEYAAAVIRKIRDRLGEKYSRTAADELTILYGGSVTAETAADYLRQPGINGLLPGAASVKAKEFLKICTVAARV